MLTLHKTKYKTGVGSLLKTRRTPSTSNYAHVLLDAFSPPLAYQSKNSMRPRADHIHLGCKNLPDILALLHNGEYIFPTGHNSLCKVFDKHAPLIVFPNRKARSLLIKKIIYFLIIDLRNE